MGRGEYLQVAGAALEVVGLLLVAAGISERRRLLWPDKRNFVVAGLLKLSALTGRTWLWFRVRILGKKPPSQTISGSGIGSAESFGSARATITREWDRLSSDEALVLIKDAIDQHERRLEVLDEKVRGEGELRTQAIENIDKQKLPDTKKELRTLIKEASAGNLGQDAWGVGLFIAGVILNTSGNVIAF